MEFQEVVRRRRMVRAFSDQALPPGALDRLLDTALRAPSAGNTRGWAFLVLDTSQQTGRYWSATLPPEQRAAFPWPGLLDAPALVVVLSSEQPYHDRYAEPDKAGLRGGPDDWLVPYWHVDAGFAALLLLLGAVDLGLGAAFFALPADRVDVFRSAFGVPPTWTPAGVVALGHAAPDRRSASLSRPAPTRAQVVHRGRWGPGR